MTSNRPTARLLSTLAICWALAWAICWAYPPGRATSPPTPNPPPPTGAGTTQDAPIGVLGMIVITVLIALPITAFIAAFVEASEMGGVGPAILAVLDGFLTAQAAFHWIGGVTILPRRRDH